jgi:hypothetical protein
MVPRERRLLLALATACALAGLVAAWTLAFAAFQEHACHMHAFAACSTYPVAFAAFTVAASTAALSAVAGLTVALRRR